MSSSSPSTSANVDGIVLGIDPSGKPLAPTGDAIPSDISAQWAASRASAAKPGQLRVFYNAPAPVAAVSLGEQRPAPTTAPDALPSVAETFLRNERLERTRLAAAKGARALRDQAAPLPAEGVDKSAPAPRRTIAVDSMHSPHAAAVGAYLGLWSVNHFKTRGPNARWGAEPALQGGRDIEVTPLAAPGAEETAKKSLKDEGDTLKPAQIPLSWWTGEVYAKAQNWARELKETPANLMTPSLFCAQVSAAFKGLPNTSVTAHDEDWARARGMNSYLSVTAGTDEPGKILEIHYKGAADENAPTLALVGKGICFDSGGISIKPGAGMKLMRADMGGAAACVAAALAIAQLRMPINLVVVTPLAENLPSGKATKPGDIVTAMNGLTIEIDNTDAEGRLVLADALTYVSREHKPHTLVDVATLTGAQLMALGHVYTGAFTENESLWHELKEAGEAEADLMWRMPLDDRYSYSISGSNADLCNVGRPAGACTAAIFLKNFVEGLEDREKGTPPSVRYAHLDIAGSMETDHGIEYQNKALTGRPTRALVEFARRFAAQRS